MIEVAFDKMVYQLEDELDGAHKYVECAIAKREEHPELADMYLRMANNEMDHANSLHEAIKKYLVKENAPHELMEIWRWQSEKFVSKAADIRARMEIARR